MEQKRTNVEEDDYVKCGEEANWEVVERLLFIYAKLNQGTKYIQVRFSSWYSQFPIKNREWTKSLGQFTTSYRRTQISSGQSLPSMTRSTVSRV